MATRTFSQSCDDVRTVIIRVLVIINYKFIVFFQPKLEEREKHYISSSHLGLIRCLTPFRVRISTIASI